MTYDNEELRKAITRFANGCRRSDGTIAPVVLPEGGREGYVAWRAAWRSLYADLTVEIRADKARRSEKGITDHQRSSAQERCSAKRFSAMMLLRVRQGAKEAGIAARAAARAAVPEPAVSAATEAA